MINKMNRLQQVALAMSATFAMSTAIPLAATAQTHHRNIIQRHPNVTAAVAGYGAYRAAKHHTRSGHRNLAQRHPILTGVAAAGVAHHLAKHHH